MDIQGSKGGSQHTPVESPNTLKSTALVKILDLVSEGEIVGLVDGMKSVYLDETPMQNPDGTMNFKNVLVEHRFGTQTQDHIAGYPSTENEVGVGTELKQDTNYTHAFTNLALDAVRIRLSTPALSTTNVENGDTKGGSVSYAIDLAINGGPFNQVIGSSFTGKCMTKYERVHRIALPKQTAGSTGWIIRVRRTTANSALASVQDKTFIESYTEIVDAKLRYPNSALVGVMCDASQFQQVPTRIYDLKGRIIRVPSNYNATTRVYTGTWDGTFQLAWTDNPAWIYFDLVTHTRYGLGHLISDAQVNKWALYEIGQYCDELVPNGAGGTEPRFTCNLYLQTQADAYKVITDLATVFRGMSYWANGEVMAVADKPETPVFTYTPANVIDGTFVYQGTARKTRATVVLSSWTDPNDFGRQKVEYVDDAVGIARYGVQQVETTAIGCNSQGQAQRMGRYILQTGIVETDTVTFGVGLEGTVVTPGSVVRIADPLRAGKRMGGRIVSGTTTVVTLDAPVDSVIVGDTLTITLASTGETQTRAISVINSTSQYTVSPAFSETPQVGNVWAIDRATLQTQRYRVLSVAEEEGVKYTIVAARHNTSKFDAVDLNTKIVVPPTAEYPSTYQVPPASVIITSHEYTGEIVVSSHATIQWLSAANAVLYEVEYERDFGNWVSLGETSSLSVEIPNCLPGSYQARVTAINALGIRSLAATSAFTPIVDAISIPGYASDLQLASDAAAAAAAAALLLAQQAQAELDIIANDAILTPAEKSAVMRDVTSLLAEQSGIDAQATALGITTEVTAYDAALTALNSYLATLTTPSMWNNTDGNTNL